MAPARQWAEAAIALATEQGFRYRLATGAVVRGWALAAQGQADAGIAQLREGLAIYQQTGARMELPYYLALLAEAHGWQGAPAAGLAALAEALALVRASRTFFYEAELYRLRGWLRWQADPSGAAADAAADFREALAVARRQGAKMLELRAALSLARLAAARDDGAQPLVAALYEQFTEGLDTLDLQEARAWCAEQGARSGAHGAAAPRRGPGDAPHGME